MRKFCTIAMAFVLALCLTQCKKTELTNDTPTNENPTDSTTVASGETVFITLKVSQDNDSRLEVVPPHVYFETGDKIHVASNGKYVGTMTYSSETRLFSANIVASQVAPTQPLHFYLLGNKTPTEPLTIGTTTSCTINISDQTEYLPVVSYAPSNEKFNETTEFTAILRNQCALVRFDVTTPSTSPICITGMKNKVTVDFTQNTMTPSKEGEGVIMLPAGSGENVEKWAILLPQEEALEEGEEGSAYSKDGAYQGKRPNIPIIQKNAYITDAIAVSVTNEVDPTSLPIVATGPDPATNITTSTAICHGTISANSGENIGVITEYGISYSTTPGFEGSTGTRVEGWDLNGGSFTVHLTGLNDNCTYYYRAYATNAIGTAYGEEIWQFQTQEALVPEVVTLSVTPISGTSAIGECEVTSDGGATVIARGICWSTGQDPTINNPYTNSGTGIGNYSATLTELQPGTTYYVSAFATNSKGTNYGDVIVLNMPNFPSVTSSDATNITEASATSGGNVTSDGGATVTERGICWSTSQNPTINDAHVSNGNGIGGFTADMTGLNSNTTYYMRAYAINLVGIQYGDEKSFTTLALIEVSANPSEGGRVEGGGTYLQGVETCTVTAEANDGYAFINWTENGEEVSTEAEYTFTVESNHNLVANFIPEHLIPEYTISVSSNAIGVGTVTGGGTYRHGETCTVKAIPNEGYIFFYWLENGEIVPYADAEYSFKVTSDRTLEAFFIKPLTKDAN